VNYTTRKRYRGEPICADPTADPHENETALHFTAGDRRLWISSYEPAVVAGLLARSDFQIGHLVLTKANGRECVVGVVGKLPVGALSLGRTRRSDSHELIVPGKSRLPVFAAPIEEKKTLASKKKLKEEPRQLKLKLAGRAKSHTTKQPKKARKSRVRKGKTRAKATRRRATHRSSGRAQRTRST
jgi:hypothetical protein